MVVKRTLPAGMVDAGAQRHTRPFHLVRVDLPAPYGTQFLSTGPQVDFLGDEYSSGMVEVGPVEWDADGVRTTRMTLYLLGLPQFLIANGLSEFPVVIYESYWTFDDEHTEPKVCMSGVTTDSVLHDERVEFTVSSTTMVAERTPNRFVTPAEGFNWLPRPGGQVRWGGELFVFEE